eukprot:gene9873-12529_t
MTIWPSTRTSVSMTVRSTSMVSDEVEHVEKERLIEKLRIETETIQVSNKAAVHVVLSKQSSSSDDEEDLAANLDCISATCWALLLGAGQHGDVLAHVVECFDLA